MPTSHIKRVDYFEAESPVSHPIADATHQILAIRFIIARLTLENGTVGESYMLAFHYNPAAIGGALSDVRQLAVGRDVGDTRGFDAECDRAFEYFGQIGLLRWARGLINIAMWDARGHLAGKPVRALLGSEGRLVPVYGSGGWLSYSDQELVEEARAYVRRGYRAVKMKVGMSEGLERDLERITLVREAVGPEVHIMIDANQGLTVDAALELTRRAGDLRISWFEEPITNTDFRGYAELREQSGVQLAMGEREYDLVALRELGQRRALDFWQPDVLRLGGVEGWIRSARLAGEHGLRVAPHFYKEYDASLCCTISNAYGVESFDWVDGLVDRPLRVESGHAHLSEEPGWGFRFTERMLRELEI